MNTNAIKLRKVILQDFKMLKSWDSMPHLVDQVPTADWHREEELLEDEPWRNQFIAECDGQPIGYIDIIDPYYEPSKYWGEVPQGLRAIDIWIGEPQFLGKGHGTTMMHLAIEFCFSFDNVSAILVDPYAGNKRAHRFYEKLGFQFKEKRYFGKDECCVYRLSRDSYNH
jgi:aminoglycoside 6'-N-acetyltransferase